MPDYSRGKIYKILCNETGKQYFGSTCEPTLARRLAKHIQDYKQWLKEGKLFFTSFFIFEKNNYHIELIELFPCSSRDELMTREKYHIKNNECVNKCIPMRTEEEKKEYHKIYNSKYYEDNKVYHEEYYENNKEKVKQQHEMREEQLKQKFNCECGGKYTFANRTIHNKTHRHQNYLAMDASLAT